MNKNEDADSIVRTIIALQPTNLNCVPSVLKYWALRKEDEEGGEEENDENDNVHNRKSSSMRRSGKSDDDEDDEDEEKNKPLGLWANASNLGLGDVTSKQQIASEWNTRTNRAELIHASVYIFRKRSRDRFAKLNRCVRELQSTQRIAEDLIYDLSEKVESLTTTKLAIEDDDDDDFKLNDDDDDHDDNDDDDEQEEEDEDADGTVGGEFEKADTNSMIGRGDAKKKVASDDVTNDYDSKIGRKEKDVASISSSKNVSLSMGDRKNDVEDSKADSSGVTSTSSSSSASMKDSKAKEREDRKAEQSKTPSATKKVLSGMASNLTAKMFNRNGEKKKKDKFTESARQIQEFQDELNSTVAELQAERLARDENDLDHDLDNDDDDDGDDEEDGTNTNKTSSEVQNWKEFKFSREFMKRWKTVNKNDPIDQSWDTLNTKLKKHEHRETNLDGSGETEGRGSSQQKNKDETQKEKNESKQKKTKRSGWRRFVPFVPNSTDPEKYEGEEDEKSEESEEDTLPDLLNLDQINDLWDMKDHEWREYLAMNRPETLINKRIEVEWEDGYESGTITQFNRNTRKHTVQYDDGELRKYDLRRKNYRFLIGGA